MDVFRAILVDFERLVLPLSDAGVDLAGWDGEHAPEITADLIAFNGRHNCGHAPNEEIVVPYPTEDGQGVGPSASAIADVDDWVVRLKHRCCNGSCRYATFSFARQMTVGPYMRPNAKGLFIDCVKTAFRPYDVAVTAVLLVAKRYLHDELIIHSDGADTQWVDAKQICQQVLGYGDWFGIVEQEIDDSYEDSNGVLHARQAVLLGLVEIRPGSLLPLE